MKKFKILCQIKIDINELRKDQIYIKKTNNLYNYRF